MMTSSPLLRLSLSPTSSTPFTTTRHHHLPSNPLLPLAGPTCLRLRNTQTLTTKPLKITNFFNNNKFTSSSTTPAIDRLISAASYCLPFFNGIQYGRFLFSQYPSLRILFEPLLPVISLYHSLPFANFIVFFGLYLGVVRNPSLSRYVRFNAMQALVFDVLLVVPSLVQRILSPGDGSGLRSGLGLKVMVFGHNAVFVFLVACCLYSIVNCVLGKTPYLPFVADAAGRQL